MNAPTDTLMRLYLVRHGQTDENVRQEIQGQLPGRLSPLGLEQATALGERFRDVPLDTVISSDLRRAMQTADAIALPHRLPVAPEPLLREQHYGIYQGRPLEHLYGDSGFEGVVRQAEGGESMQDLRQRAEDLWERWRTDLVGKTAVAVSHGAFLSILLPTILGKSAVQEGSVVFSNGGIAAIHGSGESFRLVVEDESEAGIRLDAIRKEPWGIQ